MLLPDSDEESSESEELVNEKEEVSDDRTFL